MTQSDWREKPLYDLVVHAWPHSAKDFPPFAKDDWNRVAEQVPSAYWQPWIRDRWSSGGKFCPKPNEVLFAYRESRVGGAFHDRRKAEQEASAQWEHTAARDRQLTAMWADDMDDAAMEALRDRFAARGRICRDFFTEVRQDRRDAREHGRSRTPNLPDRLLTAAEIRREPFLLGILRGHDDNERSAVVGQ